MDDCARQAQQAAIIANAFAVAIAKGMTVDEQNIIGNLFALIGASLLSIAAINQTCKTAIQNAANAQSSNSSSNAQSSNSSSNTGASNTNSNSGSSNSNTGVSGSSSQPSSSDSGNPENFDIY